MSQSHERDAVMIAREELQGELLLKNTFTVVMVGTVLFISALIVAVM